MTEPTEPDIRRRLTLRARVTLLVAMAVGLAVAVTSAAAYITVRRELSADLDKTLLSRAYKAASGGLSPGVFAETSPGDLGAGDVSIAVLDSTGRGYANSRSTAPPLDSPELAVAQGRSPLSIRTVPVRGQAYRVVAVPYRRGLDGGLALVLAESTDRTDSLLRQLGLVLLVVGGIGVVGAACSGLVIAKAGLAPVERLTEATEHVARTDRLDPIPVRGDDELARLTESFNHMLASLSGSRLRQQQLIADASHELRTPLTSLRTNIELLSQEAGSTGQRLDPAERDELLADVRAQLEEMTLLVKDLVELAREDVHAESAAPVELTEVLDRAVERVRRRAPTLRWQVTAAPWEVYGDSSALERAVTNLLDNAAKWSPPDGTVTITLADGVLQVADEGPGIADIDLPHVFERFYRSAEARPMAGSGLGLAIVRQVAERHGGAVTAGRAAGGGALLTLYLPGRWPDSRATLNDGSGSSQESGGTYET